MDTKKAIEELSFRLDNFPKSEKQDDRTQAVILSLAALKTMQWFKTLSKHETVNRDFILGQFEEELFWLQEHIKYLK